LEREQNFDVAGGGGVRENYQNAEKLFVQEKLLDADMECCY